MEDSTGFAIFAAVVTVFGISWGYVNEKESEARRYKGRIENCEVSRELTHESYCLDCPPTAIERLEVKCGEYKTAYTDIKANGQVDSVAHYRKGRVLLGMNRVSSRDQKEYERWQKMVDDAKRK